MCQVVFDHLSRSKVKIVGWGWGEEIVMGYPVYKDWKTRILFRLLLAYLVLWFRLSL